TPVLSATRSDFAHRAHSPNLTVCGGGGLIADVINNSPF
ncbi:uncharacterized, partial [Tachysurus ichikawai]